MPGGDTALLAALADVSRTDLAEVGGKGAHLGELIRAGFPVPDGFVVTVDAYALIAAACDLQRCEQADGAAIRAEVHAAPIPEPLRTAITDAYAGLGGGPVAVRSSATAEDLPTAAFAGQHDTYLNVVGPDQVLEAIRGCWASLWTDRAIDYRRKHGIDSATVRIAVVVQCMVEAEVAGVMFTADPVTGDRDHLVIEASSGLGEAVVSGLVTPDHYVLDGRGTIRESTPGRRERVITGTEGGGTQETHDTSAIVSLPAPVLRQLACLGGKVARHFGRPQDIEWAYADDRLYLLQARPMTALPPPPVRLNRMQRRLAAVLLEYLPVRPYPIDMSTWIPHGPAGMMATLMAHFGIRGALPESLPEHDGVVDRFVPPAPLPTLGVFRGLLRFVRLARRYDPARWTSDPRLADFLARVRDIAAQDPGAMPWQALIRLPRQALDLIQPILDLRISYLPRTGLALLRLKFALVLLRQPAMMGDLIVGGATRTADANRALETLAQQARENPRLQAALAGLDPQALAEFPRFQATFRRFLDEYGHRETVSPILATPPTEGEDPGSVLARIALLAGEPPRSVDPTDMALSTLLSHRLLHGRTISAHFTRWVHAARCGVAFREDTHFYCTKPLPVLRRSILEIGRRLQEAGVLQEAAEVFHLRLEELEDSVDPGRLTEAEKNHLRTTVHSRASRRAELAGVPLIASSLVFPPSTRTDALVTGTPACAGVVTGTVKVVRGPADFAKLTPGDVLVCPYTNPAWTPLFPLAAAVVVDAGGPLSHAAIVAREYGIPTVMGTARGTTVLTDGQRVTVDAHSGTVTAADS